MKIEPVILAGDFVRLEPFEVEHFDALWKTGNAATILAFGKPTVGKEFAARDLRNAFGLKIHGSRKGSV